MSVLCKEQGITVVAVCITYDLFVFHQVSKLSSPPLIVIVIMQALFLLQHTLQSSWKLLFKGGNWPLGFRVRVLILLGFTVLIMFLRLQIMQTTLPVFTV